MNQSSRQIPDTASLRDAMVRMDAQRVKLLFVVEPSGRFVAPISMGDIQRYYLEHNHFNTNVGAVVLGRESYVANALEPRGKVEELMRRLRLEAMPIIGNDGKISEVIEWSDLVGYCPTPTQIQVHVVVMAGGKGTRMQPLTNVIPKPLVPLGEHTILEHIIANYARSGCRRFWLSVNYKSEMVRRHMENRSPDLWQIDYVHEKHFMGTAGSLHLMKNRIVETFFVCNCDILIEDSHAEMLAHHKERGNELTAVAAIREQAVPYGVFKCESGGKLINLVEKPSFTYLVNTGMYILEPHLLDEIPGEGVFHMTDLITAIRTRGGAVGIYPVSEGSWLDLGTWDEYHRACRRLGLKGLGNDA
jgi:dTDP-glucose pyrophosphorylase